MSVDLLKSYTVRMILKWNQKCFQNDGINYFPSGAKWYESGTKIISKWYQTESKVAPIRYYKWHQKCEHSGTICSTKVVVVY